MTERIDVERELALQKMRDENDADALKKAKKHQSARLRPFNRKARINYLLTALVSVCFFTLLYGAVQYYIPELVVISGVPIFKVIPLDIRSGVTLAGVAFFSLLGMYYNKTFGSNPF